VRDENYFTDVRMKWIALAGLALSGLSWAQEFEGATAESVKDLPSAKPSVQLPDMKGEDSKPDLSEMNPNPTSSIPQPRPPVAASNQAESKDWGTDMKALQDANKKKQEETAVIEEKKAKEAQDKLALEKKEKAELKKEGDAKKTPAVSQSSLPEIRGGSENKLPPVTGLDGVQPRSMSSGDGRVNPAFNSFTGPEGSGPLGKDYQSGARPIMPPSGSYDSRLNAAGQAPQVPSGAYKQISQDPYSAPPSSEKKVTAQAKPQPLVNQPETKKTVGATPPAGYSPYDNLWNVPNPRTPPRF
jgi:hypothetical protein